MERNLNTPSEDLSPESDLLVGKDSFQALKRW
jgi:hypothetical protein